MYFQNYRRRKTWLRNCVRSPISENPRRVNIVKGPKHESEQQQFFHLFHHSEKTFVPESLY